MAIFMLLVRVTSSVCETLCLFIYIYIYIVSVPDSGDGHHVTARFAFMFMVMFLVRDAPSVCERFMVTFMCMLMLLFLVIITSSVCEGAESAPLAAAADDDCADSPPARESS